ncbi:MAG: hypothetical protein QF632_02835 [Candidatus Woesearchaeota archaeon]|jgi:hypothetical protein|nr:hypothetical protein [Candidatus Woesearchaeota archaeon]
MEPERLKKIHRSLKIIRIDIEEHILDHYGMGWWYDKRVENVAALIVDLKELRDEHNFTSEALNAWLAFLEKALSAYHGHYENQQELRTYPPKETEKLDAYLKKLVDDIKAYEEYGVGMVILLRYKFKIHEFQEAAKLLSHHPGDLIKITEIPRMDTRELFKYTLPKLIRTNLLTEENWPYLVRIIVKTGQKAKVLLDYYLEPLKDEIPIIGWKKIITGMDRFTNLPMKEMLFILGSYFPSFVKCIPEIGYDYMMDLLFAGIHIDEVDELYNHTIPMLRKFELFNMQCIDSAIYLVESGILDAESSRIFDMEIFPCLKSKDLLIPFYWPGIVMILDRCPAKIHLRLGQEYLPRLKTGGVISQERWPQILNWVKVADRSTQQLLIALKGLAPLLPNIGWENFVEGINVILESPIEHRENLLSYIDGCVKIIPNLGFELCVNKYIEIMETTESWEDVITHGLEPLISLVNSEREFDELGDQLLELVKHIQGVEADTMMSIENLKDMFDFFGLTLFSTFIIPIAKIQKVAAFLVIDSVRHTWNLQGIKGLEDLTLITEICKYLKTKANVFLKDVVIAGIEKRVMPIPISTDGEIIKAFMKEAPAYYVELYVEYKDLHMNNGEDERKRKSGELFRDVRQLKKELYTGILTKEYEENIFYSTLYYVFACNDMTVPKENYIKTYKDREDQQGSIPESLQKPLNIKLSKGSWQLQNKEDPVQDEAWQLIIKTAREVKEKQEFDVSALGFKLLDDFQNGSIHDQREYFIKWIYQHSVNNGESLPDFRSEYNTLMKYKEFIGDRMANDWIYKILSYSLEQDPSRFLQCQNTILRKKHNPRGLAKQLFGIVNNRKLDIEKSKDVLNKILLRNGFNVEDTTPLLEMTQEEILNWLGTQQPSVVEKDLVRVLFESIYGDEYKTMQSEIGKYEFKKEARVGGGKKYTLVLSKHKAHCVAMYSMGVCVAPDDKLWNQEDFWQLIIFDPERDAHGGAIFRTIKEDDKKYLIASINPSSSILSEVAPSQIFDKIIQFGKIMVKKLKYDHLLIPVREAIHSNRGSIQSIITQRFGNTDPLVLKEDYEFSYKPHNYTYKEFFIAA